MSKLCNRCNKEKPLTQEFWHKKKLNKDGTILYHSLCGECRNRHARGYVCKNKEEIAKKANKYRQTAIAKYKHYVRCLGYNFDTTEEYIRELEDKQKGCCAICGDSLVHPKSYRHCAVDHCHDTGEIRGLLCQNCNLGLGHFKDSKERMLNAIEYLGG